MSASDLDLLIRGVRLASGEQVEIGVQDGLIAAIGASVAPAAAHELDGQGLLALPGGVDPHVHFNEPGPRPPRPVGSPPSSRCR